LSNRGTSQLTWRLALAALVLLLLSVYLLIYGGRFHVIDEVSIYAMAENLAKRGALDTDQMLWSQWVRAPREVQGAFGRGGHVYSKKGFGAALIPAAFVRLTLGHTAFGLTFPAFLTNPLLTALTAWLLALYVLALGFRRGTALVLALVYGLATLALPYTRTLFGEPLAALGTVAALVALHRDRTAVSARWALLAGLGLSLSIWARLINAPALLFLWWYQVASNPPKPGASGWRRFLPRDIKRGLVFLGTVALVGVGGYAFYNAYRYGVPWKTGYQITQGEFFTTPPWIGFYGITLSPFRGLVWFSPVLVLALPGFRRLWHTHPREARMMLGIVAVYFALFSTWWMWWGGFAWGPRFLLPIIPLLVVPLAPLWESPRWRRWLFVLTGLSLVVQFLAVAADFTLTETVLENTFGHPERSRAMFDPRWAPVVLQAKHLLEGFWDIAWVHVGRAAWPVLLGGGGSMLLALGVLWWSARVPRGRLASFALAVLALAVGSMFWALAAGQGMCAVSDAAQSRPVDAAFVDALAQVQKADPSRDVLITLAPFDYEPLMNWNHTRLYVLGMAPHPAPLRPEEEGLLRRVMARENATLWLLAARIPPAHPDALAERVLSEEGYVFFHRWFGDLRLVGFGGPRVSPVDLRTAQVQGDIRFGRAIRLTEVMLEGRMSPGTLLRIRTTWEVTAPVEGNYTIFVHLLTPEGKYVVGFDGPPVNGFRPTTTWQPGEQVVDRKGVMLPADMPGGIYALEVGLYDPATGERLEMTWGEQKDTRLLIPRVVIWR